MRLALIGDGDSPHLLKWARALAPHVELWAASSRGFAPGFDTCVPAERRLALNRVPSFEGGNVGMLRRLPQLGHWLRRVDAQWIHAHYLTSHGTMACLARCLWRLRGQIVGSAWGSDILVTPERSALMRHVTSKVLRCCRLTTSDSHFMAARMRVLGAREVMVFPFGLESLPPAPTSKDDALFFANRGLEPLYAPKRVLDLFSGIARQWPAAQLVVANDGSLRRELKETVGQAKLADRVMFVGKLGPAEQAAYYQAARWYISLPESDSVSVSVLEAMAYGCVPLLSDLPANRELVRDGDNGVIVRSNAACSAQHLSAMLPRADAMATANREWIAAHAVFPKAVEQFLQRLRQLDAAR